jgi:hypothetical protein
MVRLLKCAVFLCVAIQARAAIVTFDSLPGVVENDTYNGFVGSTVDGVFYNLVCDDYDHFTDAPSGPWDFEVSQLPALTFARFGNDAAGLVHYRQAALLLAGDGSTVAGLENVTSADDITAYQYAIWKLFGASVDDVNNASGLLLATLEDLSNGTDYSSTFSELRVYTPSQSASDNQEFLGMVRHLNSTAVPEPSSSVQFLSGLAVLFALFRRKPVQASLGRTD